MTKLTVALLTYNREKYLKEAIQSILTQTLIDFKLIILDNASTDNTESIAAGFLKDHRVSYFRHKNNIGGVGNYNYALEMCDTEYLLITHDDDRMLPTMLEKEMLILESDPSIGLVCCENDHIDNNGQLVIKSFYKKTLNIQADFIVSENRLSCEYFKGNNFVSCPTVMFRAAKAKESKLTFKAMYGPPLDTAFWLDINRVIGKVYFISEMLYEYRVHSNQDSYSNSFKIFSGMKKYFLNHKNSLECQESYRKWKKENERDIFGALKILVMSKVNIDPSYNKFVRYAIEDNSDFSSRALLKTFRLSPAIARILLKIVSQYSEILNKATNKIGLLVHYLKTALVSKESEKKTVLICGEYHYSGGTWSFVKNLAHSFLELGYKVYLTSTQSKKGTFIQEYCKVHNFEHINVPILRPIDEVFFYQELLNKYSIRFMIISVAGIGALAHLLHCKARKMYFVHTPVNSWSITRKQIRFFEGVFSKDCRLITVSHYAYNQIQTLDSNKIFKYSSWIYNYVIDKYQVKQSYSDNLSVLTVGHVVSYKNPHLWLKVADMVNIRLKPITIQFVWVGDGELLFDFEGLVKNTSNIKFVGYHEDPSEYYQNASVYFQPSEFESFGLAVCESMMFGIPSVVSNRGALPELVIDKQTGFVVELNDINSIVDSIVLLLQDNELRIKFGNQARERCLNTFSSTQYKLRLQELLNEI